MWIDRGRGTRFGHLGKCVPVLPEETRRDLQYQSVLSLPQWTKHQTPIYLLRHLLARIRFGCGCLATYHCMQEGYGYNPIMARLAHTSDGS